MKPFPRTSVDGISLPRMLIGTNWLMGWSHTSASADHMITRVHATPETMAEVMKAYLMYDIDAVMGPCDLSQSENFLKGIKMAEDQSGKPLTIIDTPRLNVDDNDSARAFARQQVKASAATGAKICLIHHSCAEQLVNKNKGTMDRLPDYLDMIRQEGMVPGLSAHMPELVLYSDREGYDVQTYIQIYNCMGFLMQIEIEGVRRIIEEAKKPVMTIKSMAAGRCSPYVGITFSFASLRPQDMVTVGAFNVEEVHEDVEIAMAALERRWPDLEGRSSPYKTAVLGAEK